MKFTHSQTSFKSGRLSPKLFNRVDTAQYRDGVSDIIGMRPLPEGGADRIRGFRYLHTKMYTANVGFEDAKLFSFSTREGVAVRASIITNTLNETTIYFHPYPFVFGDYDVDSVGEQAVQIVKAGTHKYEANGFDWAFFGDYLILVHSRGDFCPRLFLFNRDGTLNSEGHWPASVGYATANEDTFIPILSGKDFVNYPFFDIGTLDGKLEISNFSTTTGELDIKGSTTTATEWLQISEWVYLEGIAEMYNILNNVVEMIPVGGYFKRVSNITGGIRAAHSPSLVTKASDKSYYNILLTLDETDMWAVSSWGNGVWPKTVCVNEGRLVFGGDLRVPMNLYGSVPGRFQFAQHRLPSPSTWWRPPRYYGDVQPTDPYVIQPSTGNDTHIIALASAEALVVVTNRGVITVEGGDTILSALSLNCKKRTSKGGSSPHVVTAGRHVFYIGNSNKALYKFTYSDRNGTYVSQDLSVLFSDLLETDSIKSIEWVPHISTLLIVMESEKMYGIVDSEDTEIFAFYDYNLSGITGACFVLASQSVADIYRGDHILALKRDLGFITLEHSLYEKGSSGIEDDQTGSNGYLFLDYVFTIVRDSANNYSFNGQASGATPTDHFPIPFSKGSGDIVVTNLDTGVAVPVNVADLTPWFSAPVEYGLVGLLDHPDINGASKILVGRVPTRYPKIATLPLEAGQQWGTAQMAMKNIDTVGVRFYKTYSFEISSDNTNWQEEVVATDVGHPTTGRADVKYTANHSRDQIIYIRNTKAEPFTILGLNIRGMSSDG